MSMERAKEDSKFESWAVLELMGHRKLAGFVQETQIAGAGMLRLDVPGDAPGKFKATQFYSPSSVYALTPTTEEVCRAFAKRAEPAPISRWELPATTAPAKGATVDEPDERDEEPGDQW